MRRARAPAAKLRIGAQADKGAGGGGEQRSRGAGSRISTCRCSSKPNSETSFVRQAISVRKKNNSPILPMAWLAALLRSSRFRWIGRLLRRERARHGQRIAPVLPQYFPRQMAPRASSPRNTRPPRLRATGRSCRPRLPPPLCRRATCASLR